MTQVEALQQQMVELRERLSAVEAKADLLWQGCLDMALAGQAVEDRLSRLEASAEPKIIVPGGRA